MAFTQEPGVVSDVVRSSFGFHLILVEEKQAPIVVPYEAPKEGGSKLENMREITAIMAGLATVWLVVDRTN